MKILVFITALFLSMPTLARECWSVNNPCPSIEDTGNSNEFQGCCSSIDEWAHDEWKHTSGSGTCRDKRHCDTQWIWNGGINPNSGLTVPGAIPSIPQIGDPKGEHARSLLGTFVGWLNHEGSAFIIDKNDPEHHLSVFAGNLGMNELDYTERENARTAFLNCVINRAGNGISGNASLYKNFLNIQRCDGSNDNDNCREWKSENIAYYWNSAVSCLINNFITPYTRSGSLPTVAYETNVVNYSAPCPANYPGCHASATPTPPPTYVIPPSAPPTSSVSAPRNRVAMQSCANSDKDFTVTMQYGSGFQTGSVSASWRGCSATQWNSAPPQGAILKGVRVTMTPLHPAGPPVVVDADGDDYTLINGDLVLCECLYSGMAACPGTNVRCVPQ